MNPRIEFAPEADQDNPYLIRILEAMEEIIFDGEDLGAFVSTESTFSDFCAFGISREEFEKRLVRVGERIGIPITRSSYLWETAAQMEAEGK
jgi:hypothetical protein